MNSPQQEAQQKKRNPAVTLAWVGLAMAILPQVIPMLLTVLGLGYAFTSMEQGADPSVKVERLADGISFSMQATKWFVEYGMWISYVGVLMIVVAGSWGFVRRKSRQTPAD